MAVTDSVLAVTAAGMRQLPYLRGMGRACNYVNALALRAGADPIVEAPMSYGARMRIDLRARSQFLAYYRGEYERRLVELAVAIADPARPAIDTGANVGFFTVPLAVRRRNLVDAAPIVAIEPVAENAERLSENIDLNDLNNSCKIQQIGLSSGERGGSITLREDFRCGAQTGSAALLTGASLDAPFEKKKVCLRRLDDLWPNLGLGSIDFIKMDVEGHEDHVLRGGREVLGESRPAILMEVNPGYYRAREVTLESAFDGVVPDNYVIFRFADRRWLEIENIGACSGFDNVFLIPEERLASGGSPYELFTRC